MQLQRRLTALVLAIAVSSGGCATLFASGPDTVPVNTNPAGAYVYVNGMFAGQTPTVVSLNRDHGGQIQIYLPGFQPVVLVKSKTLNGWFIANILWFYVIVPFVVDLVTGNYQRFDTTGIAIGLTPAQGPAPTWFQQPPQGYPQPAPHGHPPPPPEQQPGYPPPPQQPGYPPAPGPVVQPPPR